MKKTIIIIPVALSVFCLLLALMTGCRTQTLSEAALSGNLAGVKRQLDRGTDINTKDPDGWTPLMVAADQGKLEVVKILLDRGADVNVKDAYGWTPLMLALEHEPTVRILVAKGADVNAKNSHGLTPLMLAVRRGYTEVADFLKKHGAKELPDPSAEGSGGQNAATDKDYVPPQFGSDQSPAKQGRGHGRH